MKGKRDKQIILEEKKNEVVWRDICLMRYDRKLFTSEERCRIASVGSLKNALSILRSSPFAGDHGWSWEEGSHTQVWQPFLLQFRDVFSLGWEDKGGSKNAGVASAGSGCAPCHLTCCQWCTPSGVQVPTTAVTLWSITVLLSIFWKEICLRVRRKGPCGISDNWSLHMWKGLV